MTNKNLIDPLMPAQEMRLHMGEMTSQELRTARAAIAWANSEAAALIEQQDAVIASLSKALAEISKSWPDSFAARTARAALLAAKTHLE